MKSLRINRLFTMIANMVVTATDAIHQKSSLGCFNRILRRVDGGREGGKDGGRDGGREKVCWVGM